MYDKKRERGIEHTNLLIYLERYTAFVFEMVYCTQQITRKYKQHNLSLGRVVWWVKAFPAVMGTMFSRLSKVNHGYFMVMLFDSILMVKNVTIVQ